MKKYLFIILGIALAIVSCKKNSDDPTSQPIDNWVGSYDGVVDAKGTISSEPISFISDTLFDRTIDVPMTVRKLSSQRALVTMKYGLVPIPFNAVIDGNTASLDDYELVPTIDIPIVVGGMVCNINGIKFSKMILNYDNGVVTGNGKAVVTAESTLLGGLAKVNLTLDLTPNFTKK